jgi:hypothetical protein
VGESKEAEAKLINIISFQSLPSSASQTNLYEGSATELLWCWIFLLVPHFRNPLVEARNRGLRKGRVLMLEEPL